MNRLVAEPQITDFQPMNRRQVLGYFANGFGMVAFASLLADEASAAPSNPLAVKPPQFSAKARRVIFLFMSGGPSHVDLFDSKPRLDRENGKPLPFEMPKLVRTKTGNLLGSPFKFKGGGGTTIGPALSAALKLAGKFDSLVVLTDFYISDSDSEETKKMFERCGDLFQVRVLASIGGEPDLPPRWNVLNIREDAQK